MRRISDFGIWAGRRRLGSNRGYQGLDHSSGWRRISSGQTLASYLAVLGGSNPTHEKQYDKDDQDDADDADAAVTVAVAVAAEAATEATKQEDDKYDDKYQPDRHDLSPVAAPNRTLTPKV